MSDQRFILTSDRQFTAAKSVLVSLYNDRASGVAHEVVFRPYKHKRSIEQNARYWAILNDIADQLKPDGREYSPEVWHEYFKSKFIGKDTVEVNGDVVLVPKSSTKLNVEDFGIFMTKVEVWAVNNGVQFEMDSAA